MNTKIAVIGTGYVGLSIATLLSKQHEAMAVDIIPEKLVICATCRKQNYSHSCLIIVCNIEFKVIHILKASCELLHTPDSK